MVGTELENEYRLGPNVSSQFARCSGQRFSTSRAARCSGSSARQDAVKVLRLRAMQEYHLVCCGVQLLVAECWQRNKLVLCCSKFRAELDASTERA